MRNGDEVRALVLGAGVSALAVLRSLGRSGVPVFAAGADTTLVRRSRWYRPAPGDSELRDGLAEYLRTSDLPRAVLFGCTDDWAETLAALPADLADRFPAVVAEPHVLRALTDKEAFAEAARAAGVATPRTQRLSGPDDLAALSDQELVGAFLKPADSQRFSQRFGVKALSVRDRAHAEQLLGPLAEEQHVMLLQEYIPGPPTGHVFLDGYVDRAGVMRACVARRRLRMHPPDFGNSTLSVTVPEEEAGDAVDSLRLLFHTLGYRGLFDAEFVYDQRDGRFKVIEVNARPWWQLGILSACGVDVVPMAYRDALGLPIRSIEGYRVGCTWVHPLPDARSWWATRGRGAGGFPPRYWLRDANAVYSRDDPGPAVEELGRALHLGTAAVRRRARRVRIRVRGSDAGRSGPRPGQEDIRAVTTRSS
jgi:predicted ATP-grasp superfamily ATP-dependent carboligase